MDDVRRARLAETMFGAFFASSPDPMVVFDADLRIVAANTAYEAYVERPASELIGALPEEGQFRFVDGSAAMADLVRGIVDTCHAEMQWFRPSGEPAWATVVGQAVHDDAGRVRHIGMYLHDITASRRRTAELAQRVEVESAIAETTAALAEIDSLHGDAVLADLCDRLTVACRVEFLAVLRVRPTGEGVLLTSGTGAGTGPIPVGIGATERLLGLPDETDTAAIGAIVDAELDRASVELVPLGDAEPVGWLAIRAEDHRLHPDACRAVIDFFGRAGQRLAQRELDERSLALHSFVNDTASRYLAHRFTGRGQEALDETLAGLAGLLHALNVQFRIVDWEANTSVATSEWSAPEHSPMPEEFRCLDLEDPLFRDIAAATEPVTFTVGETRSGLPVNVLNVPLVINGRTTATLNLSTVSTRQWRDDEIEACRAVAGLMVQLRQRTELEQALARRLDLQELIREVAVLCNEASAETAESVRPAAVRLIGRALEADRVTSWTLDHEAGMATVDYFWQPDTDDPQMVVLEIDLADHADLTELFERSEPTELTATDLPTTFGPPQPGHRVLYVPSGRAGQARVALSVESLTGRPFSAAEIDAVQSITALLLQVTERATAENYFSTAFENAPVGISLRDADERLLACNPAFEDFVGRTQEDLLGTTVEALEPTYLDPIADTGEREFALERPDGTTRWGRVSEATVARPGDRTLLQLRHITDITATREAMAQLEYQAGHDELTGLANRRVLLDELRTCVGDPPAATDAAVLLIDLDRFKVINDSLGHSIGDSVLQVIADRLRLTVRPQDLVCRLGGDEFVVLLRGPVSPLESAAVAGRLLSLISEPIDAGATRVFTSGSIGIANPTSADDNLEDVLRHADAAMYVAKGRGRNRFEVFDQRHRAALQHRVEVESDLRRAVERGEFELHFQPEIELTTGRVLGAEALVRWPHPRLGLLDAGNFIDIAEETGQVVELGRLVLDRACRQAAHWNAGRDQPLVVRVNLSAHQLDRVELVDEVRRALQAAELPPEQLCLEITETALMADIDESLRLLERLRSVGVLLAIDDFGTGFSSLAYLKRFPVDILKIDQTFVRGLGRDPDDEAIVRSVLHMADALGLDVVAEGIESAAQRALLVRMGCVRGQGFGLARPASAAALADVLGRGEVGLEVLSGLD